MTICRTLPLELANGVIMEEQNGALVLLQTLFIHTLRPSPEMLIVLSRVICPIVIRDVLFHCRADLGSLPYADGCGQVMHISKAA